MSGSKVADLAGPGIGNYEELEKILPNDWSALHQFGMRLGEELCTDMRAVRKDYFLDDDHSVCVDQWDRERVIPLEQRSLEFLKDIVNKIGKVLVDAELYAQELFPELRSKKISQSPREINFPACRTTPPHVSRSAPRTA